MTFDDVTGLLTTVIHDLSVTEVEGPHWRLISVEPNAPGVPERIETDAAIRPDLAGSFTTCTATPGAIAVQSVRTENDVPVRNLVFLWTFVPPPGVIRPGEPIPPEPPPTPDSDDQPKRRITGEVDGMLAPLSPDPISIFGYSISFASFPQGPDVPVFQAFNGFAGDFMKL